MKCFLCSLVIFCLLATPTFAATAHAEDCSFELSGYHYVDFALIENLESAQVAAKKQSFANILAQKQAEFTASTARWTELKAKLDTYIEAEPKGRDPKLVREYSKTLGYRELDTKRTEITADIEQLNHLVQFTDRVLQRKANGEASPFLNRLKIDAKIPVVGKTAKDVADEVRATIVAAGIDPETTVLRFFGSPREDVVRLFGTDRAGSRESFQQHENDEMYRLASLMDALGIKQEDGFCALPFCEMVGESDMDRFPWFELMQTGQKSLLIYAEDKVEPVEGDIFTFANPAEKKDALLGVISPR